MNISKRDLERLEKLNNKKVIEIVNYFYNLCKPESVRVLTGTKEDIKYIRRTAIESGEEQRLNIDGHTVHFDGFYDQGRDVKNTKVLVNKRTTLSRYVETIDRTKGLKEIFGLMDKIMKGKTMYVCFYCLGPSESIFSIPALQITDSAYVVHSENILYRQGYKDFLNLRDSNDFFYFVHSTGTLGADKTSKDIDKKRIYIDLKEQRVFSINTQYAGNSVGLKKLALRIGTNKALKEGWLCEHMFLISVSALDSSKEIYLSGAYPSMCGKTSTAMLPGNKIIGDDIAYLKIDEKGRCVAANAETGIFGIIQGINPHDDPIIYEALTTPREVIFSNVLVYNGMPYWVGMGKDMPKKGINYSGEWYEGKIDEYGNPIMPSHKNARFTISLKELKNVSKKLNNKRGVVLDGIIYGSRDSDTCVPVAQALSWDHGVFLASILESETTAASLRKEGELVHNPMANIEFSVVPIGRYIENHFRFGDRLKRLPIIFTTNYFLKKNGEFTNSKLDKKVWLSWIVGRIENNFCAIETPIGFIPKYEDLRELFYRSLNKDYSFEDYSFQFSIRVKNFLEKLKRMEKIFRDEKFVPKRFWVQLNNTKNSLYGLKNKFRKDIVTPSELIDC